MTNLFFSALLAVLLCFGGLVRAHVRQTSDAIIVEGNYKLFYIQDLTHCVAY